jgi:hypothetical protein
MTDILIRDQVEIERQRDAFDRLDRINGTEKDLAVMKAAMAGELSYLKKEIERSVSQNDLKDIRREMGEVRRDVSAEIQREVEKIHMEFEKSNEAWAEKILVGAKTLNAEAQLQRMQETKQLARQVGLTVFAAALSIICTLIVFWMTTARP